MRVTSITPAIRVVGKDESGRCDYCIVFGNIIEVIDIEGHKFAGRFLYIELGKDVEEDDCIVLDVDNNNVAIQCSFIQSIDMVE